MWRPINRTYIKKALRKFKSNQQIFKEFLAHWYQREANTLISLDDFLDYYLVSLFKFGNQYKHCSFN